MPHAPATAEAAFALSAPQEAIWFLEQLGGEARPAPVTHAIRLEGPLTVCALERALNQVVARHGSLRTRFDLERGQPRQQVMASSAVALPVTHVGHEEGVDLETLVARSLREDPMTLVPAEGRVVQCRLLRLDALEHVLVVVTHPLVSDRHSGRVLLHELAYYYPAYVSEIEPRELPPPPQFKAYAEGERAWAEANAAGEIGFWQSELDRLSPTLELPQSGTVVPDHRGPGGFTAASIELPEELGAKLATLNGSRGGPSAAVLLAAYRVLLHRWTQQTDLSIGVRSAMPADSGLMGRVENIITFRSTIEETPSFREVLRRTEEKLATLDAHRRLPFEQVLREIRPQATLDRQPLFQAMYEEERISPVRVGGLTWTLQPPVARTVAADLTLSYRHTSRGLRIALQFSTARFTPDFGQQFLESYRTLLTAAVETPNSVISILPIVPAGELRRLLVDWNQTAVPYERETCIHEAFERQAVRSPDVVAIVSEQGRWTYGELNAAADRVAAALRKAGVGPDVLVGVYLQRTPHLLAGLLGVLKAGGAYVPLDPNYPEDRLRLIMEDAKLPVIVTESGLADRTLPAGSRAIRIDELPRVESEDQTSPTRARPNSENLAYVIYTSGSTGKPKGVGITHRAVMGLVAWAQGMYEMEELSGVLFATSACFDVSVFEALVPLCLGGQIILAPNLLAIGALMLMNDIKLISGVPSAVAELVRMKAIPPSVRTVNVAGEPCPQSLVDELYGLGHVRRVVDVYGPTETTVYSVGGQRLAGGRPTIGRPLPNERVYVLDANQQPVPRGVRGELYIGGEKLARGYLNRPELTAERFLEVPALPGERLYRTGDAVRWLPNGTLEYLGRLDRQVKIRGFRVEPGEVEEVLRQHAAVEECAVIARDDGHGKILAAYVVGRGAAPDLEALRGYLDSRLPEYLVPTAWVALSVLPRSPNGKIDVRALPAPAAAAVQESRYVAPRDAIEQQLVRVWQEILNVPRVGVNDRFLDLGGHSLLAVRMLAQVERKFGQRLPVSILFRAPTVERLAKAIREEGLISRRSSLVEIQPDGTQPPIYWLHTLGGGNGAGLFRYSKLAQKLGADQPSFGLVAPNAEPPGSFEEMARFYAAEIRALQPRGPYRLGGYCFGGVLAFEVARQLCGPDERESTVIVIDAIPPPSDRLPGAFSVAYANHLVRSIPEWLLHNCRDVRQIRRRALGVARRVIPGNRPRPPIGPSAREELEEVIDMQQYPAEFRDLARAHWQAMNRYRPGYFDGRVILLRPHRPMLRKFAPEFQWRLIARDVDLHIVPGSHSDLLDEPHVGAVAAALQRALG